MMVLLSSWSCLASCIFLVTIACSCAMQDEPLRRAKRNAPIVYNVYALDHFIELVEKIEKKVSGFYDVASHIRNLGYDDEYWINLIGETQSLPAGILNSNEKDVLKKMVFHNYVGSRELGVVRSSSGETIAIGHVINGICAGFVREKQRFLNKWSQQATKTIDNLYGATISRDLAQAVLAKKNDPSLPYFGPGGSWDNSKCPEGYTRSSGVSTGASNAELLGDVDGFLLGYYLPQWVKRGVRLGQLLRMYYSTGVCYDMSVASCKRYNKFKGLVEDKSLVEEITGVAEAIYLKNSASYPNVKKEDISEAIKTTIGKFFPYIEKLHGSQVCRKKQDGCELSANLVVVMDESSSIQKDDFDKEKQFVRQIIDAFEVAPHLINIAVVEFSTIPELVINLHDYGSKSRLSCAIRNLGQKGGKTYMGKALRLVKDQVLLPAERKRSSNKSDVSNIIILLTDGKASSKSSLRQAVREVKAEVKDLTMISVGVGSFVYEELKLIATDPSKHVFSTSNFDHLLELVEGLQNRTCTTPIQMEINFKEDENNTIVTAYVSPGKVRYFEIAPRHFFGMKAIYIQIQPLFGSLSTYASSTTDTPGPTNYRTKIDPIPIGQTMTMYIPNPCSGSNITTCPSVYLGIRANEANCACTDLECTIPNQIKFTIQKGRSSAGRVRGLALITIIGLVLSRFV